MITLPRRCDVSRMTLRQRRAVVVGFVHAIAVGGFDEQHVGFGDRRGIGQHRTAVAAEIAAEQHGLARLLDAHARVRRSQQMAGVQELHGDARRHGNRPLVADGLEQRHRAIGVFRREERQRRLMARVAACGSRVPRLLPESWPASASTIFAQVRGGRGTEDASAKPLAHQPRQVSGMIQVRVRQDDGVDAPARESATDASSARAVP